MCNYCGVKGHFANKVCRSRENKEQGKDDKKGFSLTDKRRQTRRHGTKKQQAKAVEASQRQTKGESSEEDYVYTVSKGQNKKTHVNVTVNGQNVHFLIDTGKTVDIIDSNTFQQKYICIRIPDTFTARGTIPGNTRIEETVYSIANICY